MQLELNQNFFSQLIIGFGNHFASQWVDDVFGQYFTNQAVEINGQALDACSAQITYGFRSEAFAFGNNQIAVFVDNINFGNFAFQATQYQFLLNTLFTQMEGIFVIEHGQNGFRIVTQGFEQDGYWHLTAAVNTEVQQVFWIKLKIQPWTTVRNDASWEQQFAWRVGFTTVVFKEHTRRTVQLRYDNAFSTIDDKWATWRHQWDFTHVHFVFTHFFYCRLRSFAVIDDQTNARAQRCGKSDATHLALLDIKYRFTQNVMHKFQTRMAIVAYDREYGWECGL